MLWWKHVLTKKLLKFRIWFRQWRIAYVRSESYAKAEFFGMPNFPKCGFNTRHDNREVTLIEFIENRICPNIYRMFRSVDWTHDMIIVKWHLFIWHERKLWSLTNAPPVQSTQVGQWLSTLFHANCSDAQVYVLHPGQFIFALCSRRRSFLQVLQSAEPKERHFENFFVYLMMTNVMMKTCLSQKIIKISNLIRAMKNSVCPKWKLCECRIFPIAEFSEVWIQHTTW